MAVFSAVPDEIIFRERTQTYNKWYWARVREGKLEMKSRKNPKALWFPVDAPIKNIIEISADDEYLMAIDENRRLYTLYNTNEDPSEFKWTEKWGAPLWKGEGLTLPKDYLSWDASLYSPEEDKVLIDWHTGYPHWIGEGVTTVYVLNGDGRRITYLDPWLAADYSYEVCSPDRGNFEAINLGASGSTIFIINKFGQMFTRLYDFDISGGDRYFFRYSFEDQKRQHLLFSLLPIKPPLHIVARQLPAPPWIPHKRIDGEITRKISIEKKGEGGVFRTLRVEGRRDEKSGYFEKDIRDSQWVFHEIPDYKIDPQQLLLLNQLPETEVQQRYETEKRKRGWVTGGPDDAVFGGVVNGHAIGLLNFNPYCSPATLYIQKKEGQRMELTLHTMEKVRLTPRSNRGLSEIPMYFRGVIEIPSHLLKNMDDFLKEHFSKDRYHWVSVEATDQKVKIQTDSWEWELDTFI